MGSEFDIEFDSEPWVVPLMLSESPVIVPGVVALALADALALVSMVSLAPDEPSSPQADRRRARAAALRRVMARDCIRARTDALVFGGRRAG